MKKVAVVAHAGKTIGGGLEELRRELRRAGVADPYWSEVPKSKYAPERVERALSDGADLVFCEVKTRRSTLFGTPAEAIGPEKVRRLRRLATIWLAQHPVRPREIRFDVVEVLTQPQGAPVVEHIRAAF